MALLASATGLVVGGTAAVLASWLRRRIFHAVVFTGAAFVHIAWELPGTGMYGTTVAVMVLVALWAKDGNPLYEALARDSDRPRRSLFVFVPFLMTAVGGLASALLTGPYAAVGFLVAGWGDAVGEPVGIRWGRHRYRVPSLGGVPAQRSLEGSAAVFVAGWIGATVALICLGAGSGVVGVALVCATVGALAEAFSNHGLDNLTVQLTASVAAALLMG